MYVQLREDATGGPPISKLAPDALTELPGLETFASKVKASGVAIKGLLLDQEKVRYVDPRV